jgi:hypothetical protein
MNIEMKFERIGARARTRVIQPLREWSWIDQRWRTEPYQPVEIDVRRDRRGEFFDIALREDVTVEALDVDRTARHLLLLARVDGEKPRYLCGHEERHWFVAAIPEATPVSTVEGAKRALRPAVLDRVEVQFVRQGEWFFVPAPAFRPGRLEPIRRHEPISRGGGSTPHVAAEAVRTGGTVVYLPQNTRRSNSRHARGYTEREMRPLALAHPRWQWTSMLRDPELYVRGAVRHPDHATVSLREWHRVHMNTESQARAAAHVVSLD